METQSFDPNAVYDRVMADPIDLNQPWPLPNPERRAVIVDIYEQRSNRSESAAESDADRIRLELYAFAAIQGQKAVGRDYVQWNLDQAMLRDLGPLNGDSTDGQWEGRVANILGPEPAIYEGEADEFYTTWYIQWQAEQQQPNGVHHSDESAASTSTNDN